MREPPVGNVPLVGGDDTPGTNHAGHFGHASGGVGHGRNNPGHQGGIKTIIFMGQSHGTAVPKRHVA